MDLVHEQDISLSSAVRIAARSPLRSRAGPATERNPTPSSARMTCARLVLPSPGGPARRTCSSASPRPRAASSAMESCSRRHSWPMNSSSVRGRSESSSSSSPSVSSTGETSRAALMPPASGPGERVPRAAARDRSPRARTRRRQSCSRARPAHRVRRHARPLRSRALPRPKRTLQLQDDTLRRLAADAGNRLEARRVLARDRAAKSAGVEPETIASATFGPTPETESSCSKSSRSAASANPNSWRASSRTWR